MPGVKRVQLDGWGTNTAGKVICVDSDRTNPTYRYTYHAAPKAEATPHFKHMNHTPSQFHTMNKTSTMNPHSSIVSPSIDYVQVEVAKMCHFIGKQEPHLPISLHECSVCLTGNAQAQIAQCGHVFHSRCLLRWYRSNKSCPLCRGNVDRIQAAPTLVVNDVIEDVDALMAESDDDMDVSSPDEEMHDSSELMEDNDLMSFLSSDASDMEESDLLPIEDMDILEGIAFETTEKPESLPKSSFTPATTMPNYWMVLNNGQALMPNNAAARPQAPRMVHIAPRPKNAATPLTHTHAALKPMSMMPGDMQAVSVLPPSTKTNSCRCAGGCRNGRCACVKEGSMCGVTCRCTSCKNPFLSIAMAGIDVSSLIKDDCFMHNLSKIRDMMTKLHERITAPCCPTKEISILQCIDGYSCECGKTYDFSWCSNKLCDREKHKRNHCSKCKRCGDHRDVHCDNCNRCYFAGVSSSFACSCQEKLKTTNEAEKKEGEGEEGECVIM